MKRSTLYGIAAVLAVAALFFVMTTARARVQCRVCVEFRGRTNCATAVGASADAAREGAQSTACGPIHVYVQNTRSAGRPAERGDEVTVSFSPEVAFVVDASTQEVAPE